MTETIKHVRDQFNKKINTDNLVLLPNLCGDRVIDAVDSDAIALEVDCIIKSPWYEVDGVLMTLSSEIEDFSENNPIDAGVEFEKDTEINLIDDCLKRWNEEDGFYHA